MDLMNRNSKSYLLAECIVVAILFALSFSINLELIGEYGSYGAATELIQYISFFIGVMSLGLFTLAISTYREALYCRMIIINFLLFRLILFILRVFYLIMIYTY